ncbi:hypothetical protein QL285_033028 [Trifolium repens]|nr:hypothetical protein QL285_033028 [Trifolium repens]
MTMNAQELSQLRESIDALTTSIKTATKSFNEFNLRQDLRHEYYLCTFQNLHTLHKSESSSSYQCIVNVLPLSDEDEAKEIDNDEVKITTRIFYISHEYFPGIFIPHKTRPLPRKNS